MSFVYVTFTNTDRTEGRGPLQPLRAARQLETLEKLACGDGVMGTPGGVEIKRIGLDTLATTARGKLGEPVWGRRAYGDGSWGYGRHGEAVELNQAEREQLARLRKLLGDDAPELPAPPEAPVSPIAADTVLAIWAMVAESVTPAPQLYAVRDDYEQAARALGKLNKREWTVPARRGGAPQRLRYAISQIQLDGSVIELSHDTAIYVSPEGGRTPVEQKTLEGEYLALMTKAGYTR